MSVFTIGKVQGQYTELETKLDLVNGKDPKDGKVRYTITLTLKNKLSYSVYIPGVMSMYDDQLSDSIVILKNNDGFYHKHITLKPLLHSKRLGVSSKGEFLARSSEFNHLSNKFFIPFMERKKQGDKLVHEYEQKNGRFEKSINALFLSPGESFVLYFITRNDFFVKDPGEYQMSFFYGMRQPNTDMPKSILGYRILFPTKMETNHLFFKLHHRGKVILLRQK